MKARRAALLSLLLVAFLLGCHSRPPGVPSAAAWVDHTFIDCSLDTHSNANRCTVYKDDTGAILADGLFVLNTSHMAAPQQELRYIAYGRNRIFLENVTWLEERTPTEHDPSRQIVDEQLKKLASSAPASEAPVNSNPSDSLLADGATTECALQAFAARHPFFVRYSASWGYSFGYTGYAGDASGNVYFVEWYNQEWPPGERAERGFDHNRGGWIPCDAPTRLEKYEGEITCRLKGANY